MPLSKSRTYKMRKIFVIAIVALLGQTGVVFGQASGYLGKRLLVSLDFDLAPDLDALSSGMPGQSMVHRKQGLGLSYVVKNQRALGFYFNYYRSYHRSPVLSTIYFDPDDSYASRQRPEDFQDLFNPLSKTVMTGLTEIGLSYQYYLNSYVAPVGSCVEIELSAVMGKSKFYDPDLNEVLTRPVDVSKVAISPKFSLAYIHNHVVEDMVVLRYGVEFGLDFGGMASIAKLNGNDYVTFLDENYMGHRALARSTYASFFGFKLGIGFIP